MAVCALALAGCVDREPEQRAAFIQLLRVRIIDAPGAVVRPASDQERRALGGYGDQYRVIGDFQDTLRASMAGLGQALQALTLRSVADILARGAEFEALQAALDHSRQALRQARVRADEARAALLQADDLRQAYGMAYHKAVTAPAAAVLALYPSIEQALADAQRVAAYAHGHDGQFLVDGALVQVRDPSVQAQFNTLLAQLNGRSGDVEAAARQLRALAPPPG